MRGIVLTLCAASLASPVFAGKIVLWSIGKPDLSSHEFSPAIEHVAYEIGKSVPGQHWRQRQSAEDREPFAIAFSINQPPAGTFYLNVGLLFRDPETPNYLVTVNGKRGMFTLRPEPYSPVNASDLNVVPFVRHQRLGVELPGGYFRLGRNEIKLAAGGGGFLEYDTVSLEQDPNSPPPAVPPSVRIEPGVLWERHGEDLYEQVNLVVCSGVLGPGGKVAVQIGPQTFREELPANTEFGEVVVPLSVRDPGHRVPASVRIETARGSREFADEFTPQKKWKLFVASSTHLDIGYTSTQPKTVELHLRNLEQAAALTEKYSSFRWNLEGSWIAKEFLRRGGPSAAKTFQALADTGSIGVNAFNFNLQAYLCSLEELNNATDYAFLLHERNGIPFSVVTVSDVPSLPWSLPSILNRAGIRYLASAANQVRGPLLTYGQLDRRSPFFWEGPDGGRVMVWYTKAYSQARVLFGVPGSAERARRTIGTFLSGFPQSYPYDAVLVYGFDGDNAPIQGGNADFYPEWNARYAYPQIIPARFHDFFTYIEKQGTGQLPVMRGDGGAYWEDGAGECPITTAMNRGNQAAAVDLEKLASLATLWNPRLAYPHEQIDRIWENILLFDEHSFGARAGVLRPDAADTRLEWATKAHFATAAAADLRWAEQQWLERLNERVPHAQDAVIVWNLANWRRTGPVEVQLVPGKAIYDEQTGQLQPSEVMHDADNTRMVRFLARDVPPLSYKVYRVAAGESPASAPSTENLVSASIENEFYRITLDTSRFGIRSIVDKQLGRELVDRQSPYALGEYFWVKETSSVRRLPAGGGNNWYAAVRTRIDINDFELPSPALTIQHPAAARVVRLRKSAAGQEAVLEGRIGSTQPVQLNVRVYPSIQRIDLTVTVHENFSRNGSAEAGYVAFPFALENPMFAYNLPVGWVNPAKDMLPGGATEWFALDDAVSVSGHGAVVTVAMPDTPLITIGDINRGKWPKQFVPPRQASLFSYVMNNYWLTNFPAGQETGDAVFRYSITTSRIPDYAAERRFGMEQRHPLLADFRSGRAESAEATLPSWLVRVEGDTVNLVTVKRSKSGGGYILRLAECAGTHAGAKVSWRSGLPVQRAFLCSSKEQKLSELAVSNGSISLMLSPHAVETVLLELTAGSGRN